MIITIDTQDIANKILTEVGFSEEDLKAFTDNDAPQGWSNALVDLVPHYETAVYKDVVNTLEEKAYDHKGAKAEIVKRFIKNEENHSLADSLEWFESQKIITTRKAFELAEKDIAVIQLFADGTDSQLDDLEAENEYFPDKSKSWPNIETIFVTEVKL